MLDELNEVIYVCDAETYELYYVNKIGKKLTGVYDYTGKKCYEVFQKGKKGKKVCEHCEANGLQQGTFHTKIEKAKDVEFVVKEKLILWDEKPARLEVITDNSSEKW